MGFRHYLYVVPKDKLESSNIKDFIEDDDGDKYLDIREFLSSVDGECVFELGKLYYCDTLNRLEKHRKCIVDDTMREYIEDNDFDEIEADGLLEIIEYFREIVLESYQDCLKDPEECKRHINSKIGDWSNKYNIKPYNLKKESKKIVRSWFREYEIFELVRIYKEYDWDKNAIIIYGR